MSDVIQRSFAGGELAPIFHARADLARYAQALRTCKNFIVRREGGVSNRAGLRYVGAAKTDTAGTKLYRFLGGDSDSNYLLEMGAGYCRFWLNGVRVEVEGSSAPEFSAVNDYFPGDVIQKDGIFYHVHTATGSKSSQTLHQRIIDEFDSSDGWTLTNDLQPYVLGAVSSRDGGMCLRLRWQRQSQGPGGKRAFIRDSELSYDPPSDDGTDYTSGASSAWMSKALTVDGSTFSDTTSTDAGTKVAPWIRTGNEATYDNLRIILVTADFDGSAEPNVTTPGAKNTSGFYYDFDATALRIGTPSQGQWFQPTKAAAAAITRADWTSFGTPDWATVVGIFVKLELTGNGGHVDVDELRMLKESAGARTASPAPPDTDYYLPLSSAHLEVPTPYTATTMPNDAQDGNMLRLANRSVPTSELVCDRLPFNWIFRPVKFGPAIAKPTGLTATAGAAGAYTYRFVVTAQSESGEESYASDVVILAAAAEPTAAKPIVLAWTPAEKAARYNVYCSAENNGTFGRIGVATGKAGFNWTTSPVDYLTLPPTPRDLFATTSQYPHVPAFFQQRGVLANTTNDPDAIFMGRTGLPSNFTNIEPIQDNGPVTLRLADNDHHPVLHLVPISRLSLAAMTTGGIFPITGGNGPKTPITPSSMNADPETYVGSADIYPIVIGTEILYTQSRGNSACSVKFDQQIEGLGGKELSLFASHLFDRQQIVAMDYQRTPHSIAWFLRADGVLLGLTYIPEQDVWGWHRHDTDGTIEDICVVPEGDEDVLYCLVARTIGGSTKRYIERMARRDIRPAQWKLDSFFVDCGVTYNGTATHTFTGLDHLEGKVVAILGDGRVVYDGDPTGEMHETYRVTGGKITTDHDYSIVHIGLPIEYADIETLDVDIAGANVRGKAKRIGSVQLLVQDSCQSFLAGPDSSHLRRFRPQTWEKSADLVTDTYELSVDAHYDKHGRMFIRMKDPLPLTILGIIPDVVVAE